MAISQRVLSPLIRAAGINRQYRSADAARKHVRAAALRPRSYAPPRSTRRDVSVDVDRWRGWPVYRLAPKNEQPGRSVVYAHGGGWVNEMSPLHWSLVAKLAAEGAVTIIVPIYPLIPFGTAAEVVDGFVEFMRETLTADPRSVIAGDSAGGQIALATVLELRDRHAITLTDTILLSPALDLKLDNPEIPAIQPHDPILGVPGARYFAELWRGDLPVTEPRVSPLFGDLRGLGRLLIFSGMDDILAPDIRLLVDRARAAGVPFDFYEAPSALHVYPLFPCGAAKDARKVMIDRLRAR